MERTSWATIVPTVVVGAVAGVIVGVRFFSVLPPLSYFTAVTLAAVAIMCGGYGWKVKRAVEHNRVGMDRSQLHPLTVARVVALAKACTILGAAFTGGAAGLTGALAVRGQQIVAAGEELPVAIAILLTSVLLLVVGIVVEKWCEVPPGDEGSEMLGETA